MLKRAALLIVCLVCMAAGNGLAQEKVLINGIDANYPPFAYVDQSGKFTASVARYHPPCSLSNSRSAGACAPNDRITSAPAVISRT